MRVCKACDAGGGDLGKGGGSASEGKVSYCNLIRAWRTSTSTEFVHPTRQAFDCGLENVD